MDGHDHHGTRLLSLTIGVHGEYTRSVSGQLLHEEELGAQDFPRARDRIPPVLRQLHRSLTQREPHPRTFAEGHMGEWSAFPGKSLSILQNCLLSP